MCCIPGEHFQEAVNFSCPESLQGVTLRKGNAYRKKRGQIFQESRENLKTGTAKNRSCRRSLIGRLHTSIYIQHSNIPSTCFIFEILGCHASSGCFITLAKRPVSYSDYSVCLLKICTTFLNVFVCPILVFFRYITFRLYFFF